jgi:ubiquitin-like domain-containing CTD phosphatase 1
MRVTLIAKFGKERITLTGLPPETTISQVKFLLQEKTRILPKRQKLIGLTAQRGGTKGVHDDLAIHELATKGSSSTQPTDGTGSSTVIITHQFLLMGTAEEAIFVDPAARDDLPDVVDDFELDFNAGSDLWLRHVANGENLKKFTDHTDVFVMNAPRDGKPLLVLDLDHTLLDFSSRTLQRDVLGTAAAAIKRPHMDGFLTRCYVHYDLVVWSQTSWRWLETKLTELGMLTHPGYRFCFVLDKTSMFTVVSTKRDGTSVKHHVKPLQIIWSKFADRWGSHNTCHV